MTKKSALNQFSELYTDIVPGAMRLLRHEMRLEASGILTVPQFRILANINRGLDSINAISKLHGVSQPAMSRMVEGLVERGLVCKEQTDKDRRCYKLSLSGEGAELFKSIRMSTRGRLGQMAKNKGMPVEKLVEALETLKEFVDQFEEGPVK